MTTLPRIERIYETAGNTQIARIERSDLDVFGTAVSLTGEPVVTYVVACTDPCRFGPSPDHWTVETLTFVIGR